MAPWRKRLGALLLTERIQGQDWNLAEAARHAGLTPSTVRRIERGENYEVVNLDKYAACLGRPTEAWLREALGAADGRVSMPLPHPGDRDALLDQWKALSAQLLTTSAARDLLWSVLTHVAASEVPQDKTGT